MARTTFRLEGLADLEQALSELPKATARGVLKRVLKKRAQPMADAAAAAAPQKTGRLKRSIIVGTKLKNQTGKAEYAAAMAAGEGRAAAVTAMRNARREAGEGSTAEVYVGPQAGAFHGLFQEFGTAHNKAQPFLRPAFDAEAPKVLDGIKDDLAAEIEKTRKRVAKRAEGRAAAMKR